MTFSLGRLHHPGNQSGGFRRFRGTSQQRDCETFRPNRLVIARAQGSPYKTSSSWYTNSKRTIPSFGSLTTYHGPQLALSGTSVAAERKTLVLWAIREMASRAFALLVVFGLVLVSEVGAQPPVCPRTG